MSSNNMNPNIPCISIGERGCATPTLKDMIGVVVNCLVGMGLKPKWPVGELK